MWEWQRAILREMLIRLSFLLFTDSDSGSSSGSDSDADDAQS